MNTEFGECLKKGKIKEFSRGKEIAPAELEAAESDNNGFDIINLKLLLTTIIQSV